MTDRIAQTVTVTLVSPLGRHTLSLPALDHLGSFLPDLMTAIGLDSTRCHDRWTVSRSEGAALHASSSLAGANVGDNSVLYLSPATRQTGAPAKATLPPAPDPADILATDAKVHNDRTSALLASLAFPACRSAAVEHPTLHQSTSPPAPASLDKPTTLAPAVLDKPTTTASFERMRRRWR